MLILLLGCLICFFAVGVPAFFSGLVWYFGGFNKAKLTLNGGIAVFIPGALMSFVLGSHAGPVPVVFMFLGGADDQYLPWALWMLGAGLAMVVLFGWLSYRRSRARVS